MTVKLCPICKTRKLKTHTKGKSTKVYYDKTCGFNTCLKKIYAKNGKHNAIKLFSGFKWQSYWIVRGRQQSDRIDAMR